MGRLLSGSLSVYGWLCHLWILQLLIAQDQMLGQAVHHEGLVISLDQRLDIVDEFICHIVAFPVYPGAGNQLLIVSNAVYIIDAGSSHIRIVCHTVNDYHLAGISFISGLDSGTTYHEGFVYIYTGRQLCDR